MHCVAGDGIGILVASAVLAPLRLPAWVDVLGNYALSLRMTFLPEFVSMNGLMGE